MARTAAPPPQATDAERIVASRSQPDAFGAVFDRHFDAIHRYVRGRLGPDLADDLAAETFVRAFDARGRYDGAYADARPWLYAIATDLVRKHRRTEGRRWRAYAAVGAGAPAPGADEDLAERADAAALAPAAAAALGRLRAGDRDALLLVAWGELTYEDAARALGIPVGTVRSRVHRARAAVRAALTTERGAR